MRGRTLINLAFSIGLWLLGIAVPSSSGCAGTFLINENTESTDHVYKMFAE